MHYFPLHVNYNAHLMMSLLLHFIPAESFTQAERVQNFTFVEAVKRFTLDETVRSFTFADTKKASHFQTKTASPLLELKQHHLF